MFRSGTFVPRGARSAHLHTRHTMDARQGAGTVLHLRLCLSISGSSSGE